MNTYKLTKRFLSSLKEANYYAQGIYSNFDKSCQSNDEWGYCINCSKFSRFRYQEVVDKNSTIVRSCGWDKRFTEVINVTNTLRCSWCFSKFRTRCAASSLLNFFWKNEVKSIYQLVSDLKHKKISWSVLETASSGGVFTDYANIDGVIRSEYYDDVERGAFKEGIRSEDLQSLTFQCNTFDAVISLDVFEHIADPWKAFMEINRVLKPGGVGIITVPIDSRNKITKTRAEFREGKIHYFEQPAYHIDPIRQDGTLVFTEFGMDIESILRERGFDIAIDQYTTKQSKVVQFVILLKKS